LQEPNRPKTGVDKSKYVSQKEYEKTGNYSAIASIQNSGISSKYYTEIFLVTPKNRRLEHPTPCKGLGIN
jgi:hypothetical protein